MAGSDRRLGDTVGRTFGLSLAFMVAKSALASLQVKQAVERRFGARVRNGLYRPLYILFSTVGAVLLLRMVYRGPHRVVYEARPPLGWLMRAGQLVAFVLTLDSARTIGAGFFGVPQLRLLFAGDQPSPEPEAQGPAPEADGELSRRSTFGYTRHPNNWFPMAVILLEPRMTDKRAVFATMLTVHGVLGSIHEEYRLRRTYGPAYDRYTEAVPFLASPRRRRRS